MNQCAEMMIKSSQRCRVTLPSCCRNGGQFTLVRHDPFDLAFVTLHKCNLRSNFEPSFAFSPAAPLETWNWSEFTGSTSFVVANGFHEFFIFLFFGRAFPRHHSFFFDQSWFHPKSIVIVRRKQQLVFDSVSNLFSLLCRVSFCIVMIGAIVRPKTVPLFIEIEVLLSIGFTLDLDFAQQQPTNFQTLHSYCLWPLGKNRDTRLWIHSIGDSISTWNQTLMPEK